MYEMFTGSYPKVCRCRFHTGKGLLGKTPDTKLVQHIKSRINMKGPITVADYMRDVLTNPFAVSYFCLFQNEFFICNFKLFANIS